MVNKGYEIILDAKRMLVVLIVLLFVIPVGESVFLVLVAQLVWATLDQKMTVVLVLGILLSGSGYANDEYKKI